MENKRYLLALACVLASVGLVSCDDNDDKAQCDPASFVPTCEGQSYLRECNARGMIQLTQCMTYCVTTGNTSACFKADEKCDPADYPQCVGNHYLTCESGKTTSQKCDDDQMCTKESGCVSKSSCSGNAKTCDGNVPKTCVDGAWQAGTACTETQKCDQGECVDISDPNPPDEVCKDEQRTCIGATPAICQNNEWVKTDPCTDGNRCVDGKCEPFVKCETECDRRTQVCNTKTGQCEERPKGFEESNVGTLTPNASNNVCERTGTGSKLVLRGDILTKDKVYRGGGVVVSGNKITKVGEITDADMADATVITCPDAVISAGLINAHDHITYTNANPGNWGEERFNHRNEWRRGNNGHKEIKAPKTSVNETGELRMLLSGTTSIFGSGDIKGLARNLDKPNAVDGHAYTSYNTFPLGDSSGFMVDSGCTKYSYELKPGNHVPHIGEGISESALNELRCLSGDGNGAKDIFDSKLAIIHGVAATPEIISAMAEKNVKLVWSPRTNISLYGDTARIPLYYDMGVTIALGTDWIYSGSMNMLRELQCADFLNTNYFDGTLTDYDLWMAATYNSAVALGFEDVLGNLEAGKIADIAIYKKDGKDLHRAVIDAKIQNVSAVILDGKLVYGDANIMTGGNTEEFDMCGVTKKIDTKATGTSMSFADIKKADKYQPFFCDQPNGEPTCVPMRSREADTTKQFTPAYGKASYEANAFVSDPNDIDGDGIPNDKDNCPKIFNPVRIQYGPTVTAMLQSDLDGDGIGDECDPFPFCKANDETCGTFNPKDKDGDGILNEKDNCPDVANPDQKDTDGDGIGDACDACPNEAGIAALNGCPLNASKIKELRDKMVEGQIKDGTPVKTSGVVVGYGVKYDNADAKSGFFIQDGTEAGVYVYGTNSATTVAIGDKVNVEGSLTVYNGLLEITSPKVTKDGTGSVVARPITAAEALVNPNPYDSMLVTVTGVTTIAETPTFEKGDTSSWTAKDADGNEVYIDDFAAGSAFMKTAITPSTYYSSITGILVYDFKKSRIAPRSAADIVTKTVLKEVTSDVTSADWNDTIDLTLQLSAAATEDMTINLNCGTGTCANSTVTIPAGQTSATFTLTMPASGDVTVTATDADNNSKTMTITGTDPATPVSVASIVADKQSINPGGKVTLTVTLNKYAKSETTVTLTSDNEKATLNPTTLTIPAKKMVATTELSAAADLAEGTNVKVTAKVGTTEAKELSINVKKASEKFVETFDGIKPEKSSSYADIEFTSTSVTGVTWNIAKGRTDLDAYTIDGAGVMFKKGSISTTLTSGVGSISVDVKRGYSNTDKRVVKLLVDDKECGKLEISESTKEAKEYKTYQLECNDQNKSGPVKVEITNTTERQVVIDNITWTAF